MLASVGISVSRDPEADPEVMLREADVAMYRAKGAGGRRLELFDESLRREVTAQLEIENRLRHALPRHELLLAYQPILPLAGGRRSAARRSCAGIPTAPSQMLPARFLSAGRGERADRADRQLGAAHRMRAGRRLAARRARASPSR